MRFRVQPTSVCLHTSLLTKGSTCCGTTVPHPFHTWNKVAKRGRPIHASTTHSGKIPIWLLTCDWLPIIGHSYLQCSHCFRQQCDELSSQTDTYRSLKSCLVNHCKLVFKNWSTDPGTSCICRSKHFLRSDAISPRCPTKFTINSFRRQFWPKIRVPAPKIVVPDQREIWYSRVDIVLKTLETIDVSCTAQFVTIKKEIL